MPNMEDTSRAGLEGKYMAEAVKEESEECLPPWRPASASYCLPGGDAAAG